MATQLEGASRTPVNYPRVIGHFRGEQPGPMMLVVGGMHGNEPAGVLACRRALDRLERVGTKRFRGDFVAVVGNMRALSRGVRFLHKDLNRQWTSEIVAHLRAGGASAAAEEIEQIELLDTIDSYDRQARGPLIFTDLHTSSAEGAPFVTIGDTLRNRSFALNFPLPVILGLEEQIDGALLEYMNNQGHVTFGFEAGQHDNEESVRFKEAALMLGFVFSGQVDRDDLPAFDELHQALDSARRGVPRIVEVRYRHAIKDSDRFKMRPGFSNFDSVKKGQPLADDVGGVIRAPMSGRILLPLYQGQGDDGFFICRRVNPFWLRVSRWLRHMRVYRYVARLPGVAQHPERKGTLVVDTRWARFFPLQIFHLLGYRKLRRHGSLLLVTRRRFDRTIEF
ncbi:MAG: succinylglutamate desuccinylase/aspartoacylase family protein [Acidobacteriota bacterium]|nr:succinylglutamate desuccinylase/aspartoacylase family protein [Acidobacteriota bacterium]